MVLVVSPLISLMEDQVGRARKAGLQAELLNSALDSREREGVLRRAAAGEIQLLLVAPERFHVPAFRALLPRLPVSLLAVDEAHCISQWGHDFRPAYLRIGEVREALKVPVLALTATATPRVREEMTASLRLQNPVRVVGSFDRPNLTWEVRRGRDFQEKLHVLGRLLRHRRGATIVYASTRRTVEAVRRSLAGRGLPAFSYHAGLPPGRRSRVQEAFLEDPQPVVVATNAFGMGIDRPDVRLVIHYALSGSLEAYYQEAGRAGRDGEPGTCLALFGPRDRTVHDRFVALAYPPEARLRRLHTRLSERLPLREATRVPPGALRKLGRETLGEEEVRAALKGLIRTGALAAEDLEQEVVPGRGPAPGREPLLTLLSPTLDLIHLSRLRRIARAQVDSVQDYATTRACRRATLLGYFGESVEESRCGRCDICRRRGEDRLWNRIRRGVALFARRSTQ
jgi:ATP-dependent DNA helicase RecQ